MCKRFFLRVNGSHTQQVIIMDFFLLIGDFQELLVKGIDIIAIIIVS